MGNAAEYEANFPGRWNPGMANGVGKDAQKLGMLFGSEEKSDAGPVADFYASIVLDCPQRYRQLVHNRCGEAGYGAGRKIFPLIGCRRGSDGADGRD